MMATHAANKLILVEGSDYYFDILKRNVARFPNPIQLRHAMIADGKDSFGYLHHWGGTAYFCEDGIGPSRRVPTLSLSDLAQDDDICFIKIDTDGHDFKIIAASIDWLARTQPALLFEVQVQNCMELKMAEDLFLLLARAGYAGFIVWDDPGRHVVSTESLPVIQDLNRYLLQLAQGDGPKQICNYDVLCLSRRDQNLYQNISAWYRAR